MVIWVLVVDGHMRVRVEGHFSWYLVRFVIISLLFRLWVLVWCGLVSGGAVFLFRGWCVLC